MAKSNGDGERVGNTAELLVGDTVHLPDRNLTGTVRYALDGVVTIASSSERARTLSAEETVIRVPDEDEFEDDFVGEERERRLRDERLIEVAGERGSVEELRSALAQGADPNAANPTTSALARAARNGDADKAGALIDAGARSRVPRSIATACNRARRSCSPPWSRARAALVGHARRRPAPISRPATPRAGRRFTTPRIAA